MHILLYGATGYTGQLIAHEITQRGLPLIVAGRSAHAVAGLAAKLGLAQRVFGLTDEAALATALYEVAVFINCAGPFAQPPQSLLQMCIAAQVHYLDLAGEYTFFEWLAQFDEAARAANIMLMPGVGFVTAATDCMALHLAQRLPNATNLALAYHIHTAPSRGTALGAVAHLGLAGAARQNGRLIPATLGQSQRRADFGAGPTTLAYNAWSGDLVAAYRNTGIPNIQSYLAFPLPSILGWVDQMGRVPTVQRLLGWLVTQFLPAGPNASQRASATAHVWGEISNEAGQKITAHWATLEAYRFTAHIATDIAIRVLRGDFKLGFHSPAAAYGANLIAPLLLVA